LIRKETTSRALYDFRFAVAFFGIFALDLLADLMAFLAIDLVVFAVALALAGFFLMGFPDRDFRLADLSPAVCPATPPTMAPTAAPTGPSSEPTAAPAATPPTVAKSGFLRSVLGADLNFLLAIFASLCLENESEYSALA